MDMKVLYYMWLGARLYAGSESPKILLTHYNCDIEKIYNASYEDYLAAGVIKQDAKLLCDKNLEMAKKYYNYCTEQRVGILCYDSPMYPQRLKLISNPPGMFYFLGRLEMLDDHPCIAMVGTRSCSENGFRTAYRIGYEAAYYGIVPINGIAAGIDAAVLMGALDADGYVVAVLGNGIDRIYPSQNKELFRKISRRGLILSEFPPFSKPDGKNFPVRNRVMSGLSLGTLVLEADLGSGTVHTANHAYIQGRKIYAVPGDINNPLYSAPLELIKKGAKAITCASDIVEEYRDMFPHRINTDISKIKIPSSMEKLAIQSVFGTVDEKKTEQRTLPKPKRITKNKSASDKSEKPYEKNQITNAQEHVLDKESLQQEQENTQRRMKMSECRIFSQLSVEEQRVLCMFDNREFITVDDVVAAGYKVDDAMASLTLLEIYSCISSKPGGKYFINPLILQK